MTTLLPTISDIEALLETTQFTKPGEGWERCQCDCHRSIGPGIDIQVWHCMPCCQNGWLPPLGIASSINPNTEVK